VRLSQAYAPCNDAGHDAPPRQTPRLQVDVVTDYRAFLDLEAVWNKLVDDAGIDFPFVRHEWIRAFWDSFDHGGSLSILVVQAEGRPIAIAPLMRDKVRMYGLPVRRLRGIANVYTERFDFILTADPEACCAAIWTYLADHGREWDVLELRQLPEGCRALGSYPREALERQLLLAEWTSMESPYVSVRQSWETYFTHLKKGHRANMRRWQRHLEATAPVGLEVVTSNDRLENDLEEALSLEAVTWKDEGGTAIRCRADTRTFYRQILQMAGDRGWLRMYFLTLGQKRIAVRIALLFHNRVYMLKSGYDPRYAASAPGHLLSHKLLEEAWTLKFDEVDFLGNAERWKLYWSTGLRRHSWLFAFPKRPKPRLLHYLKVSLMPWMRTTRCYALLRRVALTMNVEIHRD
jgi:CelD/BcsL family acetyltransferase involved in cellulose biosynthesis